jgi:hypothetical protein
MRRIAFVALAAACLFVRCGIAAPLTEIHYVTNDLGSNRWEYIYTVSNIGLTDGIQEFTTWFDYGLYDNLVVTTPETPPDWDQIVWQIEPVLEDPGGYDALATNINIAIGESLSGFSVSFDWLGSGEPGGQYYEIIDPMDFHTIEDGYTVPEPAGICLLGLGGLALLRRRKM